MDTTLSDTDRGSRIVVVMSYPKGSEMSMSHQQDSGSISSNMRKTAIKKNFPFQIPRAINSSYSICSGNQFISALPAEKCSM